MGLDTITFAHGAHGTRLAKHIVLQHDEIVGVEPSPQCCLYAFHEEEISDLPSLMRAVWRAAQRGEIALRAKPKAPQGRRAIYDHTEHGPAGLDVVPRCWVGFDWDNIALADAVDSSLADDPAEWPDPLRQPEIGVALALERLPPAFRNLSCGWQISASAGFKPGFRLRTWHWLDHPCTGLELKAWCAPAIERKLLDPVTLVEAQPHYLAVTVTGGPDPCPQRFGIYEQRDVPVPVPDLGAIMRDRQSREHAKAIFKYGFPPDPKLSPKAATTWAEKRLQDCVKAVREAPDGTKHPTYVEEVARAKAICDRFGVEWRPIRQELKETYERSLDPAIANQRRASSTEGVLRWIESKA